MGGSNEITISGKALKKQMLANHHVLNYLVHKMDPKRPTTLACFAMCPHWHPVAHITDLVGWNLYLGWYVPFFWLNDLWIKFWHFLYPKRMLCTILLINSTYFTETGTESIPYEIRICSTYLLHWSISTSPYVAARRSGP